jgi:hypothetical protein
MARSLVPVGELAGALQDDIDAQVFPGEGGGVRLAEHADRLPADSDVGAFGGKPLRPRSVHRVVVEEMRQGLRVRDVVHGDEVDPDLALERRSQNETADPSEPVDRYPHEPS